MEDFPTNRKKSLQTATRLNTEVNTPKGVATLLAKEIIGSRDTFFLQQRGRTHQGHTKVCILHEVTNTKGCVTLISHESTVVLVQEKGARKNIKELSISTSHQVPTDHPAQGKSEFGQDRTNIRLSSRLTSVTFPPEVLEHVQAPLHLKMMETRRHTNSNVRSLETVNSSDSSPTIGTKSFKALSQAKRISLFVTRGIDTHPKTKRSRVTYMSMDKDRGGMSDQT